MAVETRVKTVRREAALAEPVYVDNVVWLFRKSA
ncbi:hypothetical protein GGR33_000036 [Methylobacterium brachythecii]|nr:hypothetical protein [Methylobacterium brachythecii]